MTQTLAERIKHYREIEEQLYHEFVEEFGRLKTGPSAKGGMYIGDNTNTKSAIVIAKIDKEEAEFIIRKLKEFFGLD